MKKLSFIIGATLVAAVLISFTVQQKHKQENNVAIASLFNDVTHPFEEVLKNQAKVVTLNPATDINVIEVEEEIQLDIDPTEYLPFGFDAYKDFQIDPADIHVIEVEEEVELGFDVNQYLPTDFNPYKV